MRSVVVATFVLAALAVPGAARAADEHTLGVQGQGEVELAPDVGTFSAEVRRTAPTSAGARSAANGRLQAIVTRLGGLGVARADITTTSVRLTRVRSRTPAGALRVRYVAAGALGVRVSGASRIGPALDAAAAAGATAIDGPEFSFSQPLTSQGRSDAEQAALADARSRADAAAASQGQRISGVQSIELDPGSTPSPVQAQAETSTTAKTSGAATPTPVLPGRQTFDSTVRVVYLLVAA